jgi:hypothetical protein
MIPESILANDAMVLSQQMRESYFEQGFILASGFLDKKMLNFIQIALYEAANSGCYSV